MRNTHTVQQIGKSLYILNLMEISSASVTWLSIVLLFILRLVYNHDGPHESQCTSTWLVILVLKIIINLLSIIDVVNPND